MLRTALVFFVLLAVLALPGSQAQPLTSDSLVQAADALTARGPDLHATLAGWAQRRRRMVLDQRHAFGDLTYDRGVFRHITPTKDREYPLDMHTYQFSPLETTAWTQMDSGLRLRTGSIVRAEWAFVTEIKQTTSLAPDHTLRIDATLQQDGAAQRSLIEFSYDWNVSGPHHAGVRHTISQYKPDFDPSFYYQYGTSRTGRLRAELTVLDAYHDLIFQTLGVTEKQEDFIRSYTQQPYMGQITLETPHRFPLRAEVYAAWQPESELVVQSSTEPAQRYRDQEAFHYVGALVEYSAGPVTGGLLFQRDRSSLDRLGLRSGVTSDYDTVQRLQRGGAFLMGTWGPFVGEAWLFLEHYYDRQEGTDFSLSTISRSMNYRDDRKDARVRVAYVPGPTGWYGSLGYLSLEHDLSEKSWIMGNEWRDHWPVLNTFNNRLSGTVGYRFDQGAVQLGINFDLDGDITYKDDPGTSKSRFDNGFIRFVTSW